MDRQRRTSYAPSSGRSASSPLSSLSAIGVMTSSILGIILGTAGFEHGFLGILPGITDPNRVASRLYYVLYLTEGLLPLTVISVLAHDSLR